MRSLLYVPAANKKALAKSTGLKPDCLIFDLEDSASAGEKSAAREVLAKHLEQSFAAKTVLVRINGSGTPFFEEDLAMVAKASADGRIDGIVLPKVNAAAQISSLEKTLDDLGANPQLQLFAMMETPLGVLHADLIAASSSRLAGFILGLEDLALSLGVKSSDRSHMAYAMQKVVLAAKAFDMLAIDGVCTDFKSSTATQAECELAKNLGFDGKSLIHPSQIDAANQVFGISASELEEAHKVIDAFEAALAEGKSVASLNGTMVEALHFEAAKTLALKSKAYEAF